MSEVGQLIPFVIPERFKDKVVTGTVKRFGTLLIEKNRIVGHMQEAAPFQQLLMSANPSSMFLQPGTLASSLTANIQLQQVKNMLSGLQIMTGAALAASVVGIGVSIIGFTMVNKKLNNLTEKLEGISEQLVGIEKSISQLTDHHRVERFAKLTALLALGEEALSRQDKFTIWGNISNQLLEEDHYYRHLLSGTSMNPNIFLDDTYPLDFCILTLESLVTVNSARFQSLFLCGELEAAKHYGIELSTWYNEAFDILSPIDIVLAKAPHQARQTGRPVNEIKQEMLQTTKPFMASLRELQANMATRPQLVQTLIDQRLNGYEYIQRLRQEKYQPLLVLPDNTALDYKEGELIAE